MIQLLSPEEDVVVHEFAALCLMSLANDYSSKLTICEQEGLGPLIRCLNSQDADVQKNAIETVASLLQVRAYFLRKIVVVLCDHSLEPNEKQKNLGLFSPQDYQTKTGLRELGGLEPILQLLDSEYAIIQKLALDALQRATEDGKSDLRIHIYK